MPIYEYDCESCGTGFEKLVRSMSAANEVECPECGSSDVHKRMSLFASSVKGGTTSPTSRSSSSSNCSPGGG